MILRYPRYIWNDNVVAFVLLFFTTCSIGSCGCFHKGPVRISASFKARCCRVLILLLNLIQWVVTVNQYMLVCVCDFPMYSSVSSCCSWSLPVWTWCYCPLSCPQRNSNEHPHWGWIPGLHSSSELKKPLRWDLKHFKVFTAKSSCLWFNPLLSCTLYFVNLITAPHYLPVAKIKKEEEEKKRILIRNHNL